MVFYLKIIFFFHANLNVDKPLVQVLLLEYMSGVNIDYLWLFTRDRMKKNGFFNAVPW